MFAQLPVPVSGAIETWLLSAAAVMVLVERALAFYKNHMREQPPPATAYVANETCSRVQSANAQRFEEIEAQQLEDDHRRKAIYDHIDNVRRELKEDIHQVQTDVNLMPSRMVELLSKTGALRKA